VIRRTTLTPAILPITHPAITGEPGPEPLFALTSEFAVVDGDEVVAEFLLPGPPINPGT
jgi:hypothetical protein